jgi:hypothetical protein
MVSDDMFASLGTGKSAEPAPGLATAGAGFDPMKTQQLPAQAERTQKLDIGATQPINAAKPQRAADGDRTQKIPSLDPTFKPEATQILDRSAPVFNAEVTQILDEKPANPTEAEKAADAQVTQRLDDSIWRLQEARRILQGLPQKS